MEKNPNRHINNIPGLPQKAYRRYLRDTRYTLPRTTEYKRRRCDGDVDQFVPKQIVDSFYMLNDVQCFALNVDVPQNVHSLFESMLSKAVKLKKAVHVHWLLRLPAS